MLWTILFFTFFWISVFLVTPVSLIAIALRLIGLGPATRPALQFFARQWARFVLFVMGAKLIVEGAEKVPRKGGLCFVGNHQGNLDTLIALALFKRPFGFTAKKEAIYLPVIGLWVILLGGVFIDRKSARKAYKSILDGAERIRKGGAMVIFPEGTRSKGGPMREFRPGALKLATMSDAVVVPVTIDGSYQGWEAERRIKSSVIRVTFHDPIPTAGMGPEERKGLAARVQAIIASRLPEPVKQPAGR